MMKAPALALVAVCGGCGNDVAVAVAGITGAAGLEERMRHQALALGAVRGWCRGRRHLPGGSA